MLPGRRSCVPLRSRLGLSPLPFREIKRRLENAGFVEASQKGSHVKFVRTVGGITGRRLSPRSTKFPAGTLRSILSQAHIGMEEWEKLG